MGAGRSFRIPRPVLSAFLSRNLNCGRFSRRISATGENHVLDALEKLWGAGVHPRLLRLPSGQGVHAGVDRLQTFIRRVSANGTRSAWYLQLDIRNYFMSIDKQVLFDLLAPCIADDETLWLTRLLVFHDCTQEYFSRATRAGSAARRPTRRFFRHRAGRGLPSAI